MIDHWVIPQLAIDISIHINTDVAQQGVGAVVVGDQVLDQHALSAKCAGLPEPGGVSVQLAVLLQSRGRLKAASAQVALEQLCDQRVSVGDMTVSMIFSLEGRRAVGAGEAALARVRRDHMLLEQRGLREFLVALAALV